MRVSTLLPLFIFFLLFSCSNELENIQEKERALLDAEMQKIIDFAASGSCTEGTTCNFIAFGSKACGGPKTYLAYNSSIDVDVFLNKVETYNENERDFNKKWNVVSDCAMVLPPNEVDCIDGKCTLIYN